ncbi:MAG: polyprenol monophosphomannose synthase [Actinomycetota bacterium]
MTLAEDPRRGGRAALVAVPTYNEREGLDVLLPRLLAVAAEGLDVLVVDDASPDGTADLVEGHARDSSRVHLLRRPTKQGLGTAYLTAFRWALERDYWAVVEMDADLSHDPAAIPSLLSQLGAAELAIGSRYVRGGSVRNWSPLRRLLSRAGNVYAGLLLGFGVRDSTSGFRAYRAEVLERQRLDSVRSEGYAFQIEMTRRVFLAGGRIVEIPITFEERTSGRSKLSRTIILEAIYRVAGWGIEDRLRGRAPESAVE